MMRQDFHRRLMEGKRRTRKWTVMAITGFLLIGVSGIVWKVQTDDSFLSFIRYRYYGWAHTTPNIFSIVNEHDTLFLANWSYSKPEFIKVTWNGDTVDRSPFIGDIDYFAPPLSAYGFSDYDSTIIRFGLFG